MKLHPDKVGEAIAEGAALRWNRRHRPPRALEHTEYTFDVCTDYGAFRDLQRHRMLTIEWQPLTTLHGAAMPEAISEIDALADWNAATEEAAAAHEQVRKACGTLVAQYAVPMAFRVRFTMRMNAREAMHVIELRTQPAGHPAYRRVCQQMHRLIAEVAGHHGIAELMRFADHGHAELGRLAAEEREERRRAGRA